VTAEVVTAEVFDIIVARVVAVGDCIQSFSV